MISGEEGLLSKDDLQPVESQFIENRSKCSLITDKIGEP